MGAVQEGLQVLDQVAVQRSQPDIGVEIGDKGTIVAILENDIYSIEFDSGVKANFEKDSLIKITPAIKND